MFIVIEGLDGSGKSTQVRMLREYLGKVKGNLDYIHFPRYEAPVYGDLISRFLRGEFGGIDEVHPTLVALLFALDRGDAAEQIRASLSSGRIVLLDRYVYSNIAYQCAKLKDDSKAEDLRRWIMDTEYGHFSLPRPDINIFLDVPVDFVESRLSASRRLDSDRKYLAGGASDIHETDMEFQKKVRKMYLRAAELDNSFIRVDCSDENGRMLSPDKVFERIRAVVDKVL